MSLRKNSIYNLLGSLVPLAVTLITLPIYIKLIGEERFGVLAIAWVLLGYFGLFDLGLGRATAQRIATLKNASPKERSDTFWTALIVNLGLGVIGGFLLWPFAVIFFSNYFQVSDLIRSEILSSLPWLIVALPVATLSGVLGGALQGREQFKILNIISVVGTVLFQTLPLFVVWYFGVSLKAVLPAVILSRVLTFTLLFHYCFKLVPVIKKPSFTSALVSPLFKFGGWVTVTSIVGPIMVVFDRFIIGAVLGAKMVAYYTVPYTLAEKVSILPSSLASALFPRFASELPEEQDRLTEESIKIIAVILTPVLIVGLFIINPFLGWWLSPEFAIKSAYVGEIILIGIWVNSFAKIPCAKIQAQGRPEIVAKCHLAELLPYIVMMYFFIGQWGIIGAALAWSVRVIVDTLLLFYFSGGVKNILKLLWFPSILIASSFIGLFNNLVDLNLWYTCIIILSICIYWCWNSAPSSLRIYKAYKF